MQRPSKPDNEAERLAALHRYAILDSEAEGAFDDLVLIAAAICGMPMSAVSLIDAERQWTKARVGMDGDRNTPRELSFCAHTILEPNTVMVVADACEDQRFRDNPAVVGEPHIRFYAGAPLRDGDGLPIGALCVMDREPRQLQPMQREALEALSRQVSARLELRRVSRDLKLQLEERLWYEQQLQKFSEELELRNLDLNEQVARDPLTGLSNRRALAAMLEQVLAAGTPFCLALLDIDRFKAVNDTHGHVAGDGVLVQVADALRASAGGHGLLARYGGEEFAWLMPDTALEQARLQCDYLREAVAFASQALPVTISVGVTAGAPGERLAEVMQRADGALYAAKHRGRNRVETA
jgi:diguanylate cyclase (GGDEF)-like protein